MARRGNAAPGSVARGSRRGSEHVDENEQAKPNNVHEMPIPRHRLEPAMVVGAVMALGAAEPDHRQHDRPEGDVSAVESGQQ